jgi:nitrate/nitrite transporter NarK
LSSQIQADYKLNNTAISVLIAVPALLGALMRIPVGILTDRFGGRVVFTGLLLFLLLPLPLLAFAHSYAAYLTGAFFLGTAGASFAINAPGALVRPDPLPASLAAAFRDPVAGQLSLFYFVTFGGFGFFANYLPQLLADWFPSDRSDAGLQVAIFTVGATLARPVGGWLADHIGGIKVLTCVFALVVVTRLILAWGGAGNANIIIVTDLLLTTAIGFGLGNGAVFKLVAQYFTKDTGLVSGLVGCAGGLGVFFPPLVMSFGHDQTGNYALGFIVLSILAGCCLALIIARSPEEARASR